MENPRKETEPSLSGTYPPAHMTTFFRDAVAGRPVRASVSVVVAKPSSSPFRSLLRMPRPPAPSLRSPAIVCSSRVESRGSWLSIFSFVPPPPSFRGPAPPASTKKKTALLGQTQPVRQKQATAGG